MSNQQRAVQARVYGRVQGVGYRIWARREATELDLAGWVRNEADGSVTASIAGATATVSTMIERLRQGPTGALVSRIDVEEVEISRVPSGFRIEP